MVAQSGMGNGEKVVDCLIKLILSFLNLRGPLFGRLARGSDTAGSF